MTIRFFLLMMFLFQGFALAQDKSPTSKKEAKQPVPKKAEKAPNNAKKKKLAPHTPEFKQSVLSKKRLKKIGMDQKKYGKVTKQGLKSAEKQYQSHCAQCHGKTGLGDGPEEIKLPITPTNFRKVKLKFGDDLPHLVETITHGRSDEVMPPYLKVMKTKDIWNMAHLIKSWLPKKYDY